MGVENEDLIHILLQELVNTSTCVRASKGVIVELNNAESSIKCKSSRHHIAFTKWNEMKNANIRPSLQQAEFAFKMR